MPIFEYQCGDCDREFEAYVNAGRTPACPACQGENLVKRLSSPGMVGASAGRASRPRLTGRLRRRRRALRVPRGTLTPETPTRGP